MYKLYVKFVTKFLCLCLGFMPFMLLASPNEKPLTNVTLTVAVYPIGAPQAFLDGDITRPKGLDIEIIHELQERLGFNLKENRIFPIDINIAFERLKNSQIDLFGGGISYTESRTVMYDYSPIFHFSSMALMYSKERMSGKVTLADFKGKRIGYQEGSTNKEYVEKLGGVGVAIRNNILAYFAVASGGLDAFIYDRSPLVSFAHEVPKLNLAVCDDRFGEELTQYAFLMPKNSPYRQIISDTMEEMMMDGTIDEILQKWNAD